MNRDDVIRVMMSIIPPDDFVDGSINEELLDEFMPLFEAIAADVRAKEREACAKVCDELHWPWHIGDNSGPKECAEAIRARGQNDPR